MSDTVTALKQQLSPPGRVNVSTRLSSGCRRGGAAGLHPGRPALPEPGLCAASLGPSALQDKILQVKTAPQIWLVGAL